MADSNRRAAGGHHTLTAAISRLPNQRSRMGTWAGAARLSRRLGLPMGPAKPVAPPATRVHARGGSTRFPTKGGAIAYRNHATDKPYLPGSRPRTPSPGPAHEVSVQQRAISELSLRSGTRPRSPPYEDIGSDFGSARHLGSNEESATPVRHAPAQALATTRRPARAEATRIPSSEWRSYHNRGGPVGLPWNANRPFSDGALHPPVLTRQAAGAMGNENPSFAPVARASDLSPDRGIMAPSSRMARSDWAPATREKAGATSAAQAPTQGTIHLDGNALGQWMARHLERVLLQPERGPTALDTRVVPDWRAANAGY